MKSTKGERVCKVMGLQILSVRKTVCPHFLSEQVCSLIIIQICHKTPKAVFGFLV